MTSEAPSRTAFSTAAMSVSSPRRSRLGGIRVAGICPRFEGGTPRHGATQSNRAGTVATWKSPRRTSATARGLRSSGSGAAALSWPQCCGVSSSRFCFLPGVRHQAHDQPLHAGGRWPGGTGRERFEVVNSTRAVGEHRQRRIVAHGTGPAPAVGPPSASEYFEFSRV